MKQGFFITLEGNDGAGKTTIAQACVERLKALGHEVVYTREPGGSRIAERIRDLLLDPGNTDMDARTEAIRLGRKPMRVRPRNCIGLTSRYGMATASTRPNRTEIART